MQDETSIGAGLKRFCAREASVMPFTWLSPAGNRCVSRQTLDTPGMSGCRPLYVKAICARIEGLMALGQLRQARYVLSRWCRGQTGDPECAAR